MRVLDEVHFRGDDRVQPAFDDAPDTMEDPGSPEYAHGAEGFGIICLKAFDHELDWRIVLVDALVADPDNVVLDLPCLPLRSQSCQRQSPESVRSRALAIPFASLRYSLMCQLADQEPASIVLFRSCRL